MEYLELTVTRCGRWMGNREFIWSGHKYSIKKYSMVNFFMRHKFRIIFEKLEVDAPNNQTLQYLISMAIVYHTDAVLHQ